MKCEICGAEDPQYFVILPLRQTNGKLDTIACNECAEKSSAYCQKHARQHSGFIDGSTACSCCVNDLVEANKARAADLNKAIRAVLPADQIEDLDEAADITCSFVGCHQDLAVLNFIATRAMRKNQEIDDIVGEIIRSRSVDCILWK